MKKNIVLALIVIFTFIACNNELRFEKIEKLSSEFICFTPTLHSSEYPSPSLPVFP